MDPARSNPLRSNDKIAALGQGTRHFAETLARRAQEVASSRLGVDYIDLHLLYWRARVPLVETIEGFDDSSRVAHRNGQRVSVTGNHHRRSGFQIMR
jgi:hypothetical protein